MVSHVSWESEEVWKTIKAVKVTWLLCALGAKGFNVKAIKVDMN